MSTQPQARTPERPLVLLVDDSTELGMIVRVLGRRSGQEVILCPDATSGWRALQDRLPDLILLDVNLPGMSGLELCRMIRSTQGLMHLSVALFSHWQMPQDVLAGLEAGVDFVVNKGLVTQPEAWQRRLQEILSWNCGQRWERLVSWWETVSLAGSPHRREQPKQDWKHELNRALRHASLKPLGPQVLRFLLLRSLRQVVSSRVGDVELASWLAPDDAIFIDSRPAHTPQAPSPGERYLDLEGVAVLVVSLAEQTWRLLGTQATAEFRSALAALVPGMEEFLAF